MVKERKPSAKKLAKAMKKKIIKQFAVGVPVAVGSSKVMKSCVRCNAIVYFGDTFNWKKLEPLCIECWKRDEKRSKTIVTKETIENICKELNITTKEAKDLTVEVLDELRT